MMNKIKMYLMMCLLFCLVGACGDSNTGTANNDTTEAHDEGANEESNEDESNSEEDGEEGEEGDEGGEDEGDEEIPEFPPEHFLQHEKFDLSMFDENSINIDNEWLPMQPGSQQIYRGSDVGDDGERQEHSLISTVTDLTKVISGVNCVVLFEQDYTEDDVLEEAELAFFAQDKEGNVWHFGQYVEHYDEDFFQGGRIWIQGPVEGAHAGYYMPAKAETYAGKDRSFSMGYAPAPFNWADRFVVHEAGVKVSNASGDYTNVLATREYSHEEPNAYQLKYYASGIGNIGVGYIGDDPNAETMDLIESKQLVGEELVKFRNEALKLEKRAFVYGTTPPSKVRK